MDTEESELTRRSSYGSYHDQAGNRQGYKSYPSTNELDPDDSWRPESQRHQVLSKGAQASTYSRGRRSIGPSHMELSNPEWERSDWPGQQPHMLQDGYYHPVTPASVGRPSRGSIIRRGGGGGGVGGSSGAMMVGFGQRGDPFAHTKKSRTKPIRNSDGVLIRKDGQPDMRSHSSAANLRKVHLRKDGEWSGVALGGTEGGTPQSGSLANSVASHDENYTTASPQAHEMDSDEVDYEGGMVEKQRREQQYVQQQQRRRQAEATGQRGEDSESPSASAVATAAMLAGEQTPPSAGRIDDDKRSSGIRGDSKIDDDEVAAATTAVTANTPATASTAAGRRQSSKSPLAAPSFTTADATEQQQQQQQQQGAGARHQAIMSKMFPHGVDANGERERERLGYSGGGGGSSKNESSGAGAGAGAGAEAGAEIEADEIVGNDVDDKDAESGKANGSRAPQAVMISGSEAQRRSAGGGGKSSAAAAKGQDSGGDDVDMKDDAGELSIAETQQ